MADYFCRKCGSPWESDRSQPSFKEYCLKCSAWLHSCLHCRFHRKTAPNQCEIPGTEAVRDREGLNYCEDFEFLAGHAEIKDLEKQEEARKKLAALFQEEDEEPPAVSFDDLFPQ
ncbi:MAG: hypothetical protein GX130_09630 [Candidatus Hydrogenedens sp.]|jgi:uncharacterized protein CbrC (UPF0167 family)|nr:hypothetical protein [Candidatus Hydrogenedens sp.]